MPVSNPPVLVKSLAPSDAGAASTSNPLLPDSRPPVASLSGETSSHPIDSDTLPRLRARGLVNSGNDYLPNAVLQLLVHCPPFWNLFEDLGKPVGKQGPGGRQETGGGATPLVNAKVKFMDEFVYKETPSVTIQLQQKVAKGKERENEEGKKEKHVVDSFNPGYLYDAMKEKRQLKHLLVRFHDQDAPLCSDSCWPIA
jgi:ubiquitin carboxyl-terminal hydrolase 10